MTKENQYTHIGLKPKELNPEGEVFSAAPLMGDYTNLIHQ
jgi:hypothetical protein